MTCLSLFGIVLYVFSVVSPVYSVKSCDFPAIFNFGDGNSDTGAFSSAFSGTPPFYGQTFFNGTAGRSSDGRLIIDFIATSLGKPFLNAYLDSLGTTFSHGANFAQLLATIGVPKLVLPKDSPPFGFSPMYLGVQLSEFAQFIERSQKVRMQGGVFASYMPKSESFAKALYTFDMGQNDLAQGLFTGMSIDQIKQSLPDLVNSFTEILKSMYNLMGARTFWIHNTGPLGCYPYILTIIPTTDVDSAGCSNAVNDLAQTFNLVLRNAVDQLRVDLPLAAITYVDIYSAYYSLYMEPQVYGLPGYKPEFKEFVDMSKGNKNLAAALLKIGDVRGSGKAPGERSGSQVNQEGGSETGHRNPVLVAEDEVVVALPKSKKRAREETSTRDLDGLSADCLVEREGLDGETSKENEFGAHRPAPISPEDRNFIGFLAGLPSESEWAGMNGRSAVDLLVETMAVYGQLGVRMAGCAAKARREIDTIAQARNALNSVGQKDERIATLEQEAAEMRASHEARATKYKNAAKTLVGERDAARAQLQECQEEVKRLQEDLKGKRPVAEVIAEFRESEEYDQELSGAAAKKIHSCWVVAERYVRANPDANWNGFVEEFMKAENATGQGEDEPRTDDPARSPPEA